MKLALITGVTGQDGSYLADFLLSKDYKVIGVKRRTSTICTSRINHLFNHENFVLEYGNLFDPLNLVNLINKYKPDELYHLAAQSHVRVSFDVPEETVSNIVLGSMRIFDICRNISPKTKIYQASSSEMYGDNTNAPQNEETVMSPASPYACAKLFSHNLARNYRESYNQFIASGILFNHESPRRGETFVTRKITRAAARIKLGLQDKLYLGNLDAKRDWGFAGDFVEAMWLMLQQDKADDFVIATGETHTVREFLNETFKLAGLSVSKHVEIDERLFRPHEVPLLLGDASKAKKVLNWEPKTKFKDLVRLMYNSDLESHKKALYTN